MSCWSIRTVTSISWAPLTSIGARRNGRRPSSLPHEPFALAPIVFMPRRFSCPHMRKLPCTKSATAMRGNSFTSACLAGERQKSLLGFCRCSRYFHAGALSTSTGPNVGSSKKVQIAPCSYLQRLLFNNMKPHGLANRRPTLHSSGPAQKAAQAAQFRRWAS